jgi:hypothetical protein
MKLPIAFRESKVKENLEVQVPGTEPLPWPKNYEIIDDDFEQKYAKVIEMARQRYAHTGGIMRLDAGERRVIVRVPSDTIIKDVRKRIEDRGMDGLDADRMLVKQCLLYPREEVIDRWTGQEGKVGICSAFAAAMMKEAEVARVAEAKKY